MATTFANLTPEDAGERPKASVYQLVTDQILAALRRGVVPWRKPWDAAPPHPVNAISKRPYRGINTFLLGLAPYGDPRWLTFNQANELGGKVRRGERSSLVTLWKLWDIPGAESADSAEEGKRRQLPILRYYRVFNVEQVEGLNLPAFVGRPQLMDDQRIHRAEEVIRTMPNPPILKHWLQGACYIPAADLVNLPPFRTFDTPDAYYATAYHEFVHATGHEKRLGRFSSKQPDSFGSDKYGREELVAELGSAFCCSAIGLDNSLIEDSASYLAGWIKTISEDHRAIVAAAGAAQRAADYIFRMGEFAEM